MVYTYYQILIEQNNVVCYMIPILDLYYYNYRLSKYLNEIWNNNKDTLLPVRNNELCKTLNLSIL